MIQLVDTHFQVRPACLYCRWLISVGQVAQCPAFSRTKLTEHDFELGYIVPSPAE